MTKLSFQASVAQDIVCDELSAFLAHSTMMLENLAKIVAKNYSNGHEAAE